MATEQERQQTLKAVVRLPENVVYRAFPAETVLLNLDTGKYHGLNPTGGRMLEVLEKADSVAEAAAQLAEDYDQPREEVERDLCRFCDQLAERGLIELDGASDD
jgi:coenzyme PQQ synthesis protein D (PqqD)